jgi:hypothetical protein
LWGRHHVHAVYQDLNYGVGVVKDCVLGVVQCSLHDLLVNAVIVMLLLIKILLIFKGCGDIDQLGLNIVIDSLARRLLLMMFKVRRYVPWFVRLRFHRRGCVRRP